MQKIIGKYIENSSKGNPKYFQTPFLVFCVYLVQILQVSNVRPL